jgi:hypothetical protein
LVPMKKPKVIFPFLFIAFAFFKLNGAYPQQLAGAYEAILCTGDCNFDKSDNVVVKGYFVFFDRPIDKETLNRQWANFEARFDVNPTACFSLERLKGSSKTFAGIIRNGAFSWRKKKDPDVIEFSIFGSADGSCTITGQSSGQWFRGKTTHKKGGGPLIN